MANNNKKKVNQRDVFDTKLFFAKYIKRYFIILLVSFVPIILLNIFVFARLNTTVIIVIDIALLLLAVFIGLIVFTKIEEHREKNPKPKEHDPFAD
jgi:hypothetical protein